MTPDPPRDAPAQDFSLLRVAAFLVRYRWSLLGLPALGFAAFAGWTALTADPVHEATARVRAPAAFDEAVPRQGVPGLLELARDGDVVELRLTASTAEGAVSGLQAVIDSARHSLRARTAGAGAGRVGTGGGGFPSDSGLAAAESAVAELLRGNPGLSALDAPRSPSALRADSARTGREARLAFELATRLSELDGARSEHRARLRSRARSGGISTSAAADRNAGLRDSIRAWLEDRGAGTLSNVERFRYGALLWRLGAWRQLRTTARKAGRDTVRVEVVSAPAVVGVRRSDALGSGIVGLLLGALLGFGAALFREALRRGRIRGDEDYEEFRDAVRGLSRLPGDGRDGGES